MNGTREIKVQVRSVYGAPTIYPANDVAEHFAAIAGTKTLSRSVLQRAQLLGFKVTQIEAHPLEMSN